MYNSVISHLAGNPEFREKGTSDRLKFLFKSSYLKLFRYLKVLNLYWPFIYKGNICILCYNDIIVYRNICSGQSCDI